MSQSPRDAYAQTAARGARDAKALLQRATDAPRFLLGALIVGEAIDGRGLGRAPLGRKPGKSG